LDALVSCLGLIGCVRDEERRLAGSSEQNMGEHIDWLAWGEPMTTDDDNATSWRDLADQLTPEQIARFEHAEQLCITGAHLAFPQNDRSKTIADMLDGVLKEARWEAQQNPTDAQ
jgi:hypothetical protein